MIVFGDMIAGMLSNKKLQLIANTTCQKNENKHFFCFFLLHNHEILNKRELRQISIKHSSDIDFKDFLKLYKKCTVKIYSFLVNDTTL